MPAELIHAVTVSSVVVFFYLEIRKTIGAEHPVSMVAAVTFVTWTVIRRTYLELKKASVAFNSPVVL